MQLYLVTDARGSTERETQWSPPDPRWYWGPGVTWTAQEHRAFPPLWRSSLLAAFLYPTVLDVPAPQLWVGEGEVICPKRLTTVACRTFTAGYPVPLHPFTATERVSVALHAALAVRVSCPQATAWAHWATQWLTGADRSFDAARTMANDYFLPFALSAAARAAMWAVIPGEEHARHILASAQAVDWALHQTVFDVFAVLRAPQKGPCGRGAY